MGAAGGSFKALAAGRRPAILGGVPNVRPYPWGELPKRRRRALPMQNALARFGREVSRAIGVLLGDDLAPRVEVLGVHRIPRTMRSRVGATRGVGLSLDAGAGAGRCVILRFEPTDVVRLARLLVGGDAGSVSIAPPPAEALGVLAAYAGAVASSLGGRVSAGLEDADAIDAALGDGGQHAVDLGMAIGPIALRMTLLWPVSLSPRAPASAPSVWPTALTLPACITAGRILATRDALDAIAPGDVVLTDESPDDAGALWLRIRGAPYRATLSRQDGALVATRIEALPAHLDLEPAMDWIDSADLPEGTGEATLTVHVELARLSLSLNELAALAPGVILGTDGVPNGPVKLRAGGVVVAEGRLVEVDGQLGVEITRVATPKTTTATPEEVAAASDEPVTRAQ